MSNNVAVIMAGGSGTRFWPSSRTDSPKQFLSFFKGKSLIQMTIDRMTGIVGSENVFIVIGEKYINLIREHIPDFPEKNLIFEPCARDTAAAIGLAAVSVARLRPGSVMTITPSDHVIDNEENFKKIILNGSKIAKDTDCLLTIGIKPDHASTAYGYIEAGEKITNKGGVDANEVKAFKEKPSKEVAQEYMDSGNYFWNSGIFIWKASTILEEISYHLPEHYGILSEINASNDMKEFSSTINKLFPSMKKISIDYGVLEKSKKILTIMGDFFWDDLGSWNAFARYLNKDDNDNAYKGNVLTVDTNNSLVINNDSGIVAVSGLDDVIVVRTEDAVLVCNRNDDQSVKKVVEMLKNIDKFRKFT